MTHTLASVTCVTKVDCLKDALSGYVDELSGAVPHKVVPVT